MKFKAGKRVAVFIYALIGVCMAAVIGLRAFDIDLIGMGMEWLNGYVTEDIYRIICVVGVAAALLVYAIGLMVMAVGRKDRAMQKFIAMESGSKGRVLMSVGALETMVRQAIGEMAEIANMKIGLENHEDSVTVKIDLSVRTDTHVPNLTHAIQRAVSEYVETNCGVAVRGVEITVSSVVAPAAEKGRLLGKKAQVDALPAADEAGSVDAVTAVESHVVAPQENPSETPAQEKTEDTQYAAEEDAPANEPETPASEPETPVYETESPAGEPEAPLAQEADESGNPEMPEDGTMADADDEALEVDVSRVVQEETEQNENTWAGSGIESVLTDDWDDEAPETEDKDDGEEKYQ